MSIAITGAGIVSAIGNNKAEVLHSLQQKMTGIGKMQHLQSQHKEIPVGEVKLSDDEMKQLLKIDTHQIISRTVLMGALAIREAIEDANINLSCNKKIALISGTTVGGMDLTERYFLQFMDSNQLLELLRKHDCGSSTQEMADIIKLDAECCTISTACSSSLNSIILGAELLKKKEADIVIAGGSESLSIFHLNGFNSLMILDQERCRPFDANRKGLNLGEGAAFVVLEREEEAKGRGIKIQGHIAGYGNSCDAFHQTATSENGEGAFLSMMKAMQMAGIPTKAIQYINAHGTGTSNNDESESTALKRIFQDQLPPISSTKSFTGHTTSASGAVEVVICLLAMANHFIPANLGWENPMENGIIPTMGENHVDLSVVLCNSFGFGGNDSSLILSKDAITSNDSCCQKKYEAEIVAESLIDNIDQLKDFKDFITPIEARRMGKLMKAATLTSLQVLKTAKVDRPDAIITGTAYGMLETSEKFLQALCNNGEEVLSPTLFMQSTHNTISSAIAIRTKCHGYNITYTQGKDSLAWALRDAYRLIEQGSAKNVLVGLHDESTELFRSFCQRIDMPVPLPIYSRSILIRRKES